MRFSTFLKSVKKLAVAATALAVLPLAVACNTSTTTEEAAVEPSTETAASPTPAPASESETIVDVAIANGSFDTLVAAVQAADLAETLMAEGPYTVFAPTDEAFAALPAGIVDTLLLPENKETLQQILTYHVVASEVPSSAISPGSVATIAGEDITLGVDAGSVRVNDATVIHLMSQLATVLFT